MSALAGERRDPVGCKIFDCPRNENGECELAKKFIIQHGGPALEVKNCAHKIFKERQASNGNTSQGN